MFNVPIFNTIKNCGYAIYNFFAYFGQVFSTKLVDNNIPSKILNQLIYNPFNNSYIRLNYSNTFMENNFIVAINNLINNVLNIPECTYVYEVFIYLAIPLALLFFTLGIIKHILKLF